MLKEKNDSLLAEKLKRLRWDRELSQARLANLAGVSPMCVKHIEDGARVDPRMSTLEGLARALNVGVEELFK